MQKIYISGPITGIDPEVCQARFEKAEKELKSQGFTPINPLKRTTTHSQLRRAYEARFGDVGRVRYYLYAQRLGEVERLSNRVQHRHRQPPKNNL